MKSVFNKLIKICSFLVLIVFITGIAESQDKKYIFFNNLDPEFAQTAYYENFQKYDGLKDYAPYAISVPFSDATFSQHNIVNFDLAIFPMGDLPLSYKSGNSSVIKKIKEMIDAGKNVIITGRTFLYHALNPAGGAKDPEVIDFLTNTMGIDYIHRKNVHKVEGNTTTWWSFIIHGHDPDPVGKSIRKGCNFESYNGGTPLAYYMSLDIFFSKDKEQFPQVEHFIYHDGLPRNDTIVAIRTEIGTSRIVLYGIGFEVICGEIPRGSLLHRCMMWTLGNIKPDGAVLQFDPVNIDFERVAIGESREMELLIESVGKEDLVITETSFFDNPDDVFEIIEGEIPFGGKPVKLKNGESHYMKIKFTPKAKDLYEALLSIYSNNESGNIKDISCVGIGGTENSGPKIATNFGKLIDFGQLRKAKSETFELKFYNTGDKELKVQTCRMDTSMPDHKMFTFAQTMYTPFFVQPGDSFIVKVKFAATSEELRVYNGRIFIECDALNESSFYIDLVGEIYEPTVSVDDGITLPISVNVAPNPAKNEIYFSINNIDSPESRHVIYLTDLLGNKLTELHNGVLESNDFILPVNTSQLSNGIYYLVIESKNIRNVTRFVISK